MDITTQELLTLLPLGAAAALFSRTFLGVKTIGTFAPALLALTIMQLGSRQAGAALLVSLGAAMLAAPLIDRLALPRPSRLALMTVVVLVALTGSGVIASDASAAPVVVLAVVLERTWDTVQASTLRDAVTLLGATVALAFALAAGLSAAAPDLERFGWAGSAMLGTAAILVVSSYRGLRLNELVRFRPVLGAAR